ncbi:MAG: carboxypeptidase regulatory-like domain-containing protein, partial [Acidobacteriia bacterium]|nr:carboxypeptidase regulatory-like domain-containing protein [Terriglobia bacterium]
MIHLRRLGWLLACLALVAGAAFGQTFYGSLVGSVQDSTGAVIPGASVTVTSLATGEQRAQETEAAGLYRFVNLVPGQYRLEARSEGFKQFAQEPITIEVDASIRIDPVLEIGEV